MIRLTRLWVEDHGAGVVKIIRDHLTAIAEILETGVEEEEDFMTGDHLMRVTNIRREPLPLFLHR